MIRAFFLLCTVGLLACSTSGSETGSADPPDSRGLDVVGHSQLTAVDVTRGDRSLLVDIWYPVDEVDAQDAPPTRYPLAGPIALESKVAVDDVPVSARSKRPLVIFSHGFQGINIQSIELMEALASHGFIVLSPEHTGNAQASPTDSFDEAAAKRVPDISFLIDLMFERNRDPADGFHARIDESLVGVLGHSFGAMTAIGTAAGWAGAEPDPRVVAIAPISSVIDGELQQDDRPSPNAGFTQQQLERIVIPVMLVGGTQDVNVPVENNAIAFEQITNAPRVYKVDLIGANHTHFAAICPIGNLLIESGLPKEDRPI